VTLGEAVLKITARAAGLVSGLRSASGHLKTFGQQAKAVGSAMTSIGMQATLMGAAITAALAPVIAQGAKFQQTMSEVQAVVQELRPSTEGFAENIQGLTSQIQELGATTKFSASQVAEAAKYLGMAGFSLAEIQETLPATLALAAAGSLELGRAADIASDSLTAFGMAAQDLNRIVDVLAHTAANSNTTVEMLGESMKYAAPVSASMGQSVEQVAAALGLLANAGIKASMGGTTLANAQAMLIKNMDKAQVIMQRYGKTAEDINPQIHSLNEILITLKETGLSAGEIFELFEMRAGRGIQAILQQSKEDINAAFEAVQSAKGTAEEMQQIKIDNLTGAFTLLKSIIEGINISIFNAIKTSLTELIQKAQEWATRIKAWIDSHQELVATIFKVVAGIGAFLTAAGAVMVVVGPIISMLGTLIAKFAAVVGAILSVKGALIALAVGVIAGVVMSVLKALMGAWDALKAAIMAFWKNVLEPFITGLKEGFKAAWESFLKPAIESLKQAFIVLGEQLEALFGTLGQGKTVFQVVGEIISGIFVVAITAAVKVIEIAVRVIGALVYAYNAVADAAIKAGRWIGLVGDDVETSTERAERLAKELKRAQAAMDGMVESQRNSLAEMTKEADRRQKIIGLLEKGNDLTAVQLQELADLTGTQENSAKAWGRLVKEQEAEVAALEKSIKAAKAKGANTAENEKLLASMQARLKDSQNAYKRLTELEKENATENLRNRDSILAQKEAWIEMDRIKREATEADKWRKENLSKITELEKELSGQRLEGLKAEIAAIDEWANEGRRLVDTALQMAQAKLAMARATGQHTEALEREIENLKRMRGQIDEEAARRQKEVFAKARKARQDDMEQRRIDEQKRRGNDLEAARLEAERMLRQEKEKIAKLYEIHDKMDAREKARIKKQRGEAERLAKERAEEHVAKAWDQIKGDRDKVVGAAQREANIEKDVASTLAKRVQSLQDLFALYQGLAMVRHAQEMRARQAADQAIKAEQQLAELKKRREGAKEGSREAERLDKLIQRAEAQVRLGQMIAGKRAGEAQLEGAAADQVEAERVAIKGKLQMLQNEIGNLHGQIEGAMQGISGVFANAPGTWVEAFVGAWQAEAQRIVDAVRATMAEVKVELDPTTTHSPSLVQVMQANVDTVAGGVNRLAASLEKATPRLRNAAVSRAVAPRTKAGFGGGVAMQPSPRVQNYNDNRSVDMVVNNNLDLDDMKRQVAQALIQSDMSSGGI